MESKRHKLDVYIDLLFLVNAFIHFNKEEVKSDEYIYESWLSFKRQMLNIDKNNILSAKNGVPFPKEEYNRVKTSLSQLKELHNKHLNNLLSKKNYLKNNEYKKR